VRKGEGKLSRGGGSGIFLREGELDLSAIVEPRVGTRRLEGSSVKPLSAKRIVNAILT